MRPPRAPKPPKTCSHYLTPLGPICGAVALFKIDGQYRCRAHKHASSRRAALAREREYLKTRPDLQNLGAEHERDLRSRDRLAALRRRRRA